MASDSTSSASNSPLVLTPESTGTPSASPSFSSTSAQGDPPGSSATASPATKKTRRGTAFYPNMNASNKPLKPFSRSAAKRESVMALGSIEHLQHFFTKTGLAARKKPLDKPHHGLVPAIGGVFHTPTAPSITSISDILLPPSPAVPSPPRAIVSPHVRRREVDPEELLPGVIEDLEAVAKAWQLPGRVYCSPTSASASTSTSGSSRTNASRQPSSSTSPPSLSPSTTYGTTPPNLSTPFDVLTVLKTTTKAIRSTRNYILSLPSDTVDTVRAQFRPMITNPSPVPIPLSNHPHQPHLHQHKHKHRVDHQVHLGGGGGGGGVATPGMGTGDSGPDHHGTAEGSSGVAQGSTLAGGTTSTTANQDPIALIRRAALDTLVILRGLEETCRLPLTDEAYDAQSDPGSGPAPAPSSSSLGPPHPHHQSQSQSQPESQQQQQSEQSRSLAPSPLNGGNGIVPHPADASLSLSFSVVRVNANGRQEDILVWDDDEPDWSSDEDGDDDDFFYPYDPPHGSDPANDNDGQGGGRRRRKNNKRTNEGWDEGLELGQGWLYRSDITLGDVEEERRVVGVYLDVVDEVLFEKGKDPLDPTLGTATMISTGEQKGKEGEDGVRGWERVRRKKEMSYLRRAAAAAAASGGGGGGGAGGVGSGSTKGAKRRVSTGDLKNSGPGAGSGAGRRSSSSSDPSRRVTVGSMLGGSGGGGLSEEPEDVNGGRSAIQEEEDGEFDDDGEEEEQGVDDEDLPEWARRDMFGDDKLARAYAFLHHFLPINLKPYLVSPSTSCTEFLLSISSGQLLCIAYNACVRRSIKPWGFINKEGVHDVIALENAARSTGTGTGTGKTQAQWTFRRTDNLRLWIGALKLRYLLPIHSTSSQPATNITPNHTGTSSTGSSSLAAAMTSSNRLGRVTSHSNFFSSSANPPSSFNMSIGSSISRPGSAASNLNTNTHTNSMGSVARSASSTPMHSPKADKTRFSYPVNQLSYGMPSSISRSSTPVGGASSSSLASPSKGHNSTPLPIHMPTATVATPKPVPVSYSISTSTPVPSSSTSTTATTTAPIPPNAILFDTRVVAKHEDGWDKMLEEMLVKWLEVAVDEARFPNRRI